MDETSLESSPKLVKKGNDNEHSLQSTACDCSHSEVILTDHWIQLDSPIKADCGKEKLIRNEDKNSNETDNSQDIATESNSASTGQKKPFAYTWYPNSNLLEWDVHEDGACQNHSCAISNMDINDEELLQCIQYESLNTEGDISDIAKDDNEVSSGHRSESPSRNSLRKSSSAKTESSHIKKHEATAQDTSHSSKPNEHLNTSGYTESISLTPSKHNVGTLWKQLLMERQQHNEAVLLLEQLRGNYDDLLQKYAEAENTIDVLRLYKGLEITDSSKLNVNDSDSSFEQLECKPSTLDPNSFNKGHCLKIYSNVTSKHGSCPSLKPNKLEIVPKSPLKRTSRSLPILERALAGINDFQEQSAQFNSENNFQLDSRTNNIKPSAQSAYLRANCLEDQMKLAFGVIENDMSESDEKELVRHLKTNLESLTNDCHELLQSGHNQSLEEMLVRLQSLFKMLEISKLVSKGELADDAHSAKTRSELPEVFHQINDICDRSVAASSTHTPDPFSPIKASFAAHNCGSVRVKTPLQSIQKTTTLPLNGHSSTEISEEPRIPRRRSLSQTTEDNSVEPSTRNGSEHVTNWTLVSGFGRKVEAKLHVKLSDGAPVRSRSEGRQQQRANVAGRRVSDQNSSVVKSRKHHRAPGPSAVKTLATSAPNRSNSKSVVPILNSMPSTSNNLRKTTRSTNVTQMCSDSRNNAEKSRRPSAESDDDTEHDNPTYTPTHRNEATNLKHLSCLRSADRTASYLHKKSIEMLSSLCNAEDSNQSAKSKVYY